MDQKTADFLAHRILKLGNITRYHNTDLMLLDIAKNLQKIPPNVTGMDLTVEYGGYVTDITNIVFGKNKYENVKKVEKLILNGVSKCGLCEKIMDDHYLRNCHDCAIKLCDKLQYKKPPVCNKCGTSGK